MNSAQRKDVKVDVSSMQAKRSRSPGPSSVSVNSDTSMSLPVHFRDRISLDEIGPIQAKRSRSPAPSCVSMHSDMSKELPVWFGDGRISPGAIRLMEVESPCSPSCMSKSSMHHPDIGFSDKDSSTDLRSAKKSHLCRIANTYKKVEDKMKTLVKNELSRQVNLLSLSHPACSEEDGDDDPIVKEALLKVTMHILTKMGETDLVETLLKDLLSIYQKKYKSRMRDKYERISETSQHGTPSLVNEIYTELNITQAWTEGINTEHEVRHLQAASRRSSQIEKCIRSNDLFGDKSVRTVLTKGVAGIGKTVSVQKFILDWAEGKTNQDVAFMFPLPFRELNMMKKKKLSVMNLLHQFFPETKELQSIDCEDYKVLWIFDGLDECRLPLNFETNEILCDVTEPAFVDVLLTNLIKGNLLPSARLWITSRPGAVNQIPLRYVGQVTEVRGFGDAQKEEYFRKRISDQSLAHKIITHIKDSKSLHIMCHLPVFCWISATVLERMLSQSECAEIPKTLTQMFTHFLIFQVTYRGQKYHQSCDPDAQQATPSILALGKLAFQQLEKGHLIFYEEDLNDCDITVKEATVYSGVCTQIFREEFEFHLGRVFCFIHLSVQEFLAALFAFLTFSNRNLATERRTTDLSDLFNKPSLSDFLRSAIDKALQSKNGHLDLFLRFLLGLSLESNQTLITSLLSLTGSSSHNVDETVEYIKRKIQENPFPEKFINLFHCLKELNCHSLEKGIKMYLEQGSYNCLRQTQFSSIEWSTLVFLLLNSTQEHEEFDLRKYKRSEECLLRLLPVVKESRKAMLCGCHLSEESCRALSKVIGSISSRLRELNLSDNKLQDEGVKWIAAGLKSEHCKLEKLWMEHCEISDHGYSALGSSLKSNPMSNLRELHLDLNEHGKEGMEMLSDLQKDPQCKLETLHINPDPNELYKTTHSYHFHGRPTNSDMDNVEFLKEHLNK